MGVGLVVNVGERVRGVAVAPVGVERCLGEIGRVVETELLGPAVREEPEIPRRFAVHRCELLDVGPSIGQRVAGARERDRRREGEQRERVVGHPLEMFHECRGPRVVATFTPDPDRLDVAAIVVARRRRAAAARARGEMAGHRGRAAGAVGPLGSDQRKPGVCPRVVRLGVDGRDERARRALLHREQSTHTLRVRRLRRRQPSGLGAGHRARFRRDRHRLGRREHRGRRDGLLANLRDRRALPQLALPDRAQAEDAGHDIAARVEQPPLVVGPYADTARVQRGVALVEQRRPERRRAQRASVPHRSGGHHQRVVAAGDGAVGSRQRDRDAAVDRARLGHFGGDDSEPAGRDRVVDCHADARRHAVTNDLPRAEILPQEAALVAPAQRAPQPSGVRAHRVDDLAPVAPVGTRRREVGSQCPAQRVEVDSRRQCGHRRQLRRWSAGAVATRQLAVTRHERDLDSAREQVQRDIDPGEPGSDHEHPIRLLRHQPAERARRPRIFDDRARAVAGQHRRHRPGEGFRHRSRRPPGRERDAVGREDAAVGEPDPRRTTRRQPHDLAVLEPHVGAREDVAQVAPVRDSRREPVEVGDPVAFEPAAEVVGPVGPGRHPSGGDVQQVTGIGRAVGRAGARPAGRVDDRDAGVGPTTPELGRDEHPGGTASGNDDPRSRLRGVARHVLPLGTGRTVARPHPVSRVEPV